jgi:hypothetical protein
LAGKTVAAAVSKYGANVKPKLASIAIEGAPEDQLRGPLETLVQDLAEVVGLSAGSIHLVGETTLAELKTRPDFAVALRKALVGFIEVKAPGKGADPRKFDDPHDKEQWDKLKSLPNLVYTDGNAFSLWRDGKLASDIVRLEGSVDTSGAKLAAPATLLPLFSDFLQWTPIPPKSAKGLAEVSARLCRLLRDEVVEQMGLGSPGLTALATDWRKLLFPQADDCAICRRLRPGGDVRPLGGALTRYFPVERDRSRRSGATKIQLADCDRTQAAHRRRGESGGFENVPWHADPRSRMGQLARNQ